MKQVWKYPLFSPVSAVGMPRGAEILHVASQGGVPTLWALVDSAEPREQRTFVVVPTGSPVEEGLAHVGTALLSDDLVFHIFERPA